MKKLTKQLAALLCAVLALALLLPAAFAAEPVTVSLSSVSGQKGQTVTVDVTISANSNAGNGSMTVSYDPAKLEFVSFKAGTFGGLAEGGLMLENGKATPGKVSIAFMASGTLQEETVLGQVSFKILDGSSTIPLTLAIQELVAYTPEGAETDLMDTVKAENASVSIQAPDTTRPTTEPTKPVETKPVETMPTTTEKPTEGATAETAVNPGTGEGLSLAACAALAAAAGAAILFTRKKREA